jgi:hypothetical protein
MVGFLGEELGGGCLTPEKVLVANQIPIMNKGILPMYINFLAIY